MIKTILVPIGNVKQAESGVRQASIIAAGFSAETRLLGIMQHNNHESFPQFADPLVWHTNKIHKQADLTKLAVSLNRQNISCDISLQDIFNFEAFIHYVQNKYIDLIVFSREDKAIYSMMRDVLAHTSVPVFVTEQKSTGTFHRILLPLDGSQRAECMLPLAATIADRAGGTLLLTHIIKEPEMPRRTSPNSKDMRLAQQLVERNRQEIEQYMIDLSNRLSVPTEIHIIVHNSITTALHEFIQQQNVDLVSLCAHGFSGQPKQPFGTITNNLIDYCSTSLIIQQDFPTDLPVVELDAVNRIGIR